MKKITTFLLINFCFCVTIYALSNSKVKTQNLKNSTSLNLHFAVKSPSPLERGWGEANQQPTTNNELTPTTSANTAYETQRKKINSLLKDRSSKFGQYDSSLTLRTGIFGLKTKKDMQRSNDILTQIVRTDNNIFKELKILLDYKDLQKNQVESRAIESEGRINKYMQTINRLQQQNEKLKAELQSVENQHDNTLTYFIIATSLLIAAIGFVVYRKNLTSR